MERVNDKRVYDEILTPMCVGFFWAKKNVNEREQRKEPTVFLNVQKKF